MIVAAAVKLGDGTVYGVPAPGRHGDAIKRATFAGADFDGFVDGFIDDMEGFVDRDRAAVIAQECGQVKKPATFNPVFGLSSEDVW